MSKKSKAIKIAEKIYPTLNASQLEKAKEGQQIIDKYLHKIYDAGFSSDEAVKESKELLNIIDNNLKRKLN